MNVLLLLHCARLKCVLTTFCVDPTQGWNELKAAVEGSHLVKQKHANAQIPATNPPTQRRRLRNGEKKKKGAEWKRMGIRWMARVVCYLQLRKMLHIWSR